MLVTCPHCKTPAVIRTSRELDDTVRELLVQCPNVYCSASWVAFVSAIRMIAPSMTPNPKVYIPLSPRSAAAQPPAEAQLGLGLEVPEHPRAMAFNTS